MRRFLEKEIKEFKEIYHKDYGVILDNKQAMKLAYEFSSMMKEIYKPVPKKYYENFKNKK